jgi:hypothetical protein
MRERGDGTVEIHRAGSIEVDLVDHIVELCVGGIKPQGFHDSAKLGSRGDA